jgi:hypothetical protein
MTAPRKPPPSPRLILSAPPGGKKVKDMTDEEIYDWARSITNEMKDQRPAVAKAAKFLKAKRASEG